MDASSIILSCLLMLQMIMILAMLNPVNDVSRITDCINNFVKYHRRIYYMSIVFYFTCVLQLGMYIPLQIIHNLMFSTDINEFEKLILFTRIEKNYLIAGFSLFLVVVMYAVRALISYTASLKECFRKSEEVALFSETKEKKNMICNEYILSNLLRVKRSISYETILFDSEMKEQLKLMIRNIDFSPNQCAISKFLETKVE